MKVYSLTDLGRKVTRSGDEDGSEMQVLQYIRENKTVTDSELEVVGGRHLVRGLKRRGLVKELTS